MRSPFNEMLSYSQMITKLALADDFLTINWVKEYPFPNIALEEIDSLLKI
jgi:hypothetical protein